MSSSRQLQTFKQIPLEFKPRDEFSFETLLAGSNEIAVGIIKQCVLAAGEQQVYIWSPRGGGKSHLLQAACRLAAKNARTVCYLPAAEVVGQPTRIFEQLEQLDVVCLDDVDQMLHSDEWEEALFDLINRLREAGASLLLGAIDSPDSLPVTLPDLRSRLAWGPVFQLQALNDSDKFEAMRIRAGVRGLELTENVAQYLMHHYPRDLFDLFEHLDRLDTAAMAMQRKLTIPFIKSVLESESKSDF